MKIGLVQKHVSLGTCTPDEAFNLIRDLRVFVRDWEASETTTEFLAGLEEAYDGDLPQTVGENEDGGAAVEA